MKYEMRAQVNIRPIEPQYGGGLDLAETQVIVLSKLSDAAEILVKLHEFFETLKAKASASDEK